MKEKGRHEEPFKPKMNILLGRDYRIALLLFRWKGKGKGKGKGEFAHRQREKKKETPS